MRHNAWLMGLGLAAWCVAAPQSGAQTGAPSKQEIQAEEAYCQNVAQVDRANCVAARDFVAFSKAVVAKRLPAIQLPPWPGGVAISFIAQDEKQMVFDAVKASNDALDAALPLPAPPPNVPTAEEIQASQAYCVSVPANESSDCRATRAWIAWCAAVIDGRLPAINLPTVPGTYFEKYLTAREGDIAEEAMNRSNAALAHLGSTQSQ